MPHSYLISFVIPAWNEESALGATLEAVSVATRHLTEPSEVIVADDGSTEPTAEIARQHGARIVTVHHFEAGRPRASRVTGRKRSRVSALGLHKGAAPPFPARAAPAFPPGAREFQRCGSVPTVTEAGGGLGLA